MPRTNFSTVSGGDGEYIGEKGTKKMLGVLAVYTSPSSSRMGMHHYTTLRTDGSVVCSCEGFTNHKKCWHIDLVSAQYDEQMVQLQIERETEEQCEHGRVGECRDCDNEFARKLLEDM